MQTLIVERIRELLPFIGSDEFVFVVSMMAVLVAIISTIYYYYMEQVRERYDDLNRLIARTEDESNNLRDQSEHVLANLRVIYNHQDEQQTEIMLRLNENVQSLQEVASLNKDIATDIQQYKTLFSEMRTGFDTLSRKCNLLENELNALERRLETMENELKNIKTFPDGIAEIVEKSYNYNSNNNKYK